MNSLTKKIICILIILIALFSINTKVFAWSQVFDDAKNFIATGESSGEGKVNQEGVKDLSGYLYNILFSAAVVIAVVVATVLGIQFITSSAEGQAKVKETLVPFVVGCIVVFGGFTFWKIAITIGNKIEKAEGSSGITISEEKVVCEGCRREYYKKDLKDMGFKCPECDGELSYY